MRRFTQDADALEAASALRAASAHLTHTLSRIELPGRVEEFDFCQIPRSFSTEEQQQRSELIRNFLQDIQVTISAQVCSIFLINENGNLRREGIIGFDQQGQLLDERRYGTEEYPLDGTSAVGNTAQPADSRYGRYFYIESVHDNCPEFVRRDKLQAQEAICGRIDPAVFVPIHGPNRSYGVLRVFNKINKEDNKPIPGAKFTVDEQIYLAQAAAYIGLNLRELRKSQDQDFSLVLQNNILLEWAKINQQVLSSDESNERKVHQEIHSIYHSILSHLARSSDSYVKSAILRLIRSDTMLAHVTSYTRDEDGYKDNEPRSRSPLDRGAQGRFNLVGEVAQTGKDCFIRDITGPDSIGLFVNQEWIQSNNLQDFFCIALKVNDDIIGTLSLFTAKNRCLALEDRRYLKGVASAIGLYTSLIFSSPDVERGKIDPRFLDRFLHTISPPQAINLHTLLLEDATPSQASSLPAVSPEKRKTLHKPPEDPGPTAPASMAPAPTEPSLGNIFVSHGEYDSEQAKVLSDILLEVLSESLPLGVSKPCLTTSSSKAKDLAWDSFQTLIVLLSDQCSSDTQLRMSEWLHINTAIWNEPQKRVIPIRLSGDYLPAFLSKFKVLDGHTFDALRQSAALIPSYPSAGIIEETQQMDGHFKSEMVKRYTELVQAIY
jgi:hypothetical protein